MVYGIMVYIPWNWPGGFNEVIFYFYFIKSFAEKMQNAEKCRKNKKSLYKIRRTNSMVYTINFEVYVYTYHRDNAPLAPCI
jgi:hypothetical protein